ncbi:DUF6089 family protein [Lewinella sp. 4G2]|uniref:DUF6089 family protein n=1 Tax=Lewinella sp. 4G2 TaxID=1803372 RepID=UPI0007B47912|nr:DUF6089 family protein [Lewinella sp. 4G2]OAV44623.1 hypothetical protein A3850_009015 [Lewinella sp. 4G2]
MRSPLNQLFFVFLLALTSTALSAQLELGVKAGGSVYSGDLSPSTFGIFADDINFAGGAYLRYRPTTRFGVRVNGNFGRLSGEDITSLPNGFGERTEVRREFRSSLSEFNIVAELDLFYVGDPESNFLAPYIFAGIGVLSFNPQARNQEGNYVDLQPLRTQGQGSGLPGYEPTPYELTTTVGIVGGGVRVRFAERFVVGLELGGRIPGTDNLDDISSQLVRYSDVLSQTGSAGAFFSNPAVTSPSDVPDLTYNRGGENNDYYFVGGLTLGIAIGRGSGKSGCYTF